jgi:hypothetical protein
MADDDFIVPAPEDVSIAGVTLKLAALTDEDCAALDRWVQAECVAAAQSTLDESCTQAEWDRATGAASKAAIGLCWSYGEGRKAMLTDRGYARLVWTGLRRQHPLLTERRVARLLKRASIEERRRLVEAYQRVNMLEPPPNAPGGKPPSPDPTQTGEEAGQKST